MSIFGIVFALDKFLFLVLNAYIRRHLLKPQRAAKQDPHAVFKGFIGPLSYLVGAPFARPNIYAAFPVYALTPLFYVTRWNERAAKTPTRGRT
jgi:TMEM175 potassium channel family protein